MTREEMLDIVESLPEEEQLWLMNHIIRKFWPEFQGKPVAFYDPSETFDDLDNEQENKFWDKKWESLQAGRSSGGMHYVPKETE
ncbi:MAG: hypothetical protein FH758_03820 [Firmicutes bacterium]|nr:hypothetical protein [Bacillota bacterium]